jgi:endonuclease/exonuclease/phosphatase (EEP) superfamily protein YafD
MAGQAGPNFPILETSLANDLGFRWVTIDDIRIYSCYWSFNIDFNRFEDFLNRLETSIRGATGMVIVVGDFNAKSHE